MNRSLPTAALLTVFLLASSFAPHSVATDAPEPVNVGFVLYTKSDVRKIVFTTNLHNIGDIDEALIRPGRCFAVVRTRGLSREETIRFLAALGVDRYADTATIVENAFSGGSKAVTLADLYRAINSHI
jgi:hypothetical protein